MNGEVNIDLFKANKLQISNHELKRKVFINLRSSTKNSYCISLPSIDQLQLYLAVKQATLSVNLAKFEMCQFHAGKFQINSHNINRNLLNILIKIKVLAIRYLIFFIFLKIILSKIPKLFSSWRWVYTKNETAQTSSPCLGKNNTDRYWYYQYNCCPAVLICLQQDCCTVVHGK